jgi:hypothetical protein
MQLVRSKGNVSVHMLRRRGTMLSRYPHYSPYFTARHSFTHPCSKSFLYRRKNKFGSVNHSLLHNNWSKERKTSCYIPQSLTLSNVVTCVWGRSATLNVMIVEVSTLKCTGHVVSRPPSLRSRPHSNARTSNPNPDSLTRSKPSSVVDATH